MKTGFEDKRQKFGIGANAWVYDCPILREATIVQMDKYGASVHYSEYEDDEWFTWLSIFESEDDPVLLEEIRFDVEILQSYLMEATQ